MAGGLGGGRGAGKTSRRQAAVRSTRADERIRRDLKDPSGPASKTALLDRARGGPTHSPRTRSIHLSFIANCLSTSGVGWAIGDSSERVIGERALNVLMMAACDNRLS